ncbi:hypothetical protein QYM36_003844, partial [Artemia franciscana]
PSLSLGNVGQLSIDLLLQSFSDEVEKVGYLNHPSLLPVVGHSPYSIDVAELYLGCEVSIPVHVLEMQVIAGIYDGQSTGLSVFFVCLKGSCGLLNTKIKSLDLSRDCLLRCFRKWSRPPFAFAELKISRRSDFVRKLVSWAKELKVNEMILLGSSSSNVRKDQQMVGPQYRYLKNDFSTLEYPSNGENYKYHHFSLSEAEPRPRTYLGALDEEYIMEED